MIDLTTVLLDAKGQPFKDGDDDATDLTVGRAIITALGAALPEERELGLDQKFARGALALKISETSEMELTAEQVSVIKRLAGRIYTAVLVARLVPMLDPAATPAEVR